MEEYALNSFPEIASKDPLRLLDLGNDAQVLYDMATHNSTGETDRAEKNILHALGEPYKPGEVFFNAMTNASPLVANALVKGIGKVLPAIGKGFKRGIKASKPFYYAKDGKILTPTGRKATSAVAKKIAEKGAEEGTKFSKYGNKTNLTSAGLQGLKTGGKTFGKAALKGTGEGFLKDAATTSVYAITRPKAYNMSTTKGLILSLLNADIEDPARFNEDDVKLAFETIWGSDELDKALNEEKISPREMISEVRTAIRENPDKADKIRADFIKNKAARRGMTNDNK